MNRAVTDPSLGSPPRDDLDVSNFNIELPQGDYHRVIVTGDDGDSDFLKAADKLAKAVHMRDAYKDIDKGQLEDFSDLPEGMGMPAIVDGIFVVPGLVTVPVPWETYVKNIQALFDLLEVGPWLSVCKTRLNVLEEKFELYKLLNADVEAQYDQMSGGGGTHTNCVKVDNSVRLTTCMTAQVLIDYIHHCVATQANEHVKSENSEKKTLADVLAAYGIHDASSLTAEGLGLHPLQRKRFNEFDILDIKAHAQVAEVLRLFLLPRGTINQGKFFAGVVRPILEAHEKEVTHRRGHARVVTEYKILINGYTEDDWAKQTAFLKTNLQVSYSKNRWVVHIQRRHSDRADAACATTEKQLENIFGPMFTATLTPNVSVDSAAISEVLKAVGAINITSDEAFRSTSLHDKPKSPADMKWSECPDDYYFFYYVWANLCVLNALRKKLGLNTIHFRPTCGESTPHWDQVVCSYLLADSVAQGIKIADSSVMQYLYLLGRIGICMSPMSNNAACFLYRDNPFLPMFKRGLLVSLSTDNPLHYHHAAEPLLEEYATALKMFHLSSTDLSEIARNSVLISTFSEEQKLEWIGSLGWEGGGYKKSLVCDFRLHFRHDCLLHEQALLNYVLHQAARAAQPPVPAGSITMVSRFANIASAVPSTERRRHNVIESRVVYPRISAGNRISTPQDYRGAVQTIGRMLNLRRKYIFPVLREAAKYRRVLVEDVFRKDHVGFLEDPDTSDDEFEAAESINFSRGNASMLIPSPTLTTSKTLSVSGPNFEPNIWACSMYYGICLISRSGTAPTWPSFLPEYVEFIQDVNLLCDKAQNDVMLDILAKLRLNVLEHRYKLHLAMNIGRESGVLAEKDVNNRDFYVARKVDNNVHTEACMNARLLFHFFTEKVKNNGDDVVLLRNGLPVTLRAIIAELGINVNRLTVDELTGRLAWSSVDDGDNDSNILKEIFLRTDNYMRGRYFAELTKLVFENNKLDDACFSEMRVEICGASKGEWQQLADWVDRYGMITAQNRWMIRLSRNYSYLKSKKTVANFGQYLDNIFMPLWEASMRPAEHTKLHYLLYNISGFDFVGDETEVDLEPEREQAPLKWTRPENPSYSYYVYYLWANIVTLNDFRKSRGLSTFTFRPQCGQAGGIQHLAVGFLLSNSISHGITLSKFPAMEYAFYLAQVGITMSPLSNTDGTVAYLDNPFPKFFMRGLNVSLSTNVPLMFHFTSEPLIEELAIASKIWILSNNDLSELSRNSVLQSGFPRAWKKEALGPLYNLKSTLGNDVTKSRVSEIRVAFRYEAYHTEMDFLDSILKSWKISGDDSGDIAAVSVLNPAADGGTERLNLPRAMMVHSAEAARFERQTGIPAGGSHTGDAMERLRDQIETLNRDINQSRKMLRDAAAQNRAMAKEIIRLSKRAEDAENDSMVIQGALIPDEELFENVPYDVEMVVSMIQKGVPLDKISVELGFSGLNARRDIGRFLDGTCAEIELRRRLLAHVCNNNTVTNVLAAAGSARKPRRSRLTTEAIDELPNGQLVVFALSLGVSLEEMVAHMQLSGFSPAFSVTNFLAGVVTDPLEHRKRLVDLVVQRNAAAAPAAATGSSADPEVSATFVTSADKNSSKASSSAAAVSPRKVQSLEASPLLQQQPPPRRSELVTTRLVDDPEAPLSDVELVETLYASGMSFAEISAALGYSGRNGARDLSTFLQGNSRDHATRRKQLVHLYRDLCLKHSQWDPTVNPASASPVGVAAAGPDVEIPANTEPNETLVMDLLERLCPALFIAASIGFKQPTAQDLTDFLAGKMEHPEQRRKLLVKLHYEICVQNAVVPTRAAPESPKPASQCCNVEMVEALLFAGLKPSEISTALGYSSGKGNRDVATFLAQKARDMATRSYKLEELYENRVRRH